MRPATLAGKNRIFKNHYLYSKDCRAVQNLHTTNEQRRQQNSQAVVSSGIMPMLAAYQFYFFSFHVGFVPVSDVLAIFVSNWQCENVSKF